jgi:esterase/lipase
MDIAARLAIIPEEILNLENQITALNQSLDFIQDPLFLSFVDPQLWMPNAQLWIHNHTQDVMRQIRILERQKRDLQEEQQELIVMATHRGN